MPRIPLAMPNLLGHEREYVLRCVDTNWISSLGEFVSLFERRFAEYCGTNHAVTCSSGTTALHLALVATGCGPGDEVIVPDLTFAATANAVVHAGAIPVLVDIDEHSWNIDPEAIKAALSPRTKAIIPVHLYGNPAAMDAIMAIADEHKLWVIEDAAEAHGSTYKGRRVGSLGHVGCFSFYGNKIVTTGEGGMCTTDRADLAAKMRLYRDHGMSERYLHDVVGYNFALTNMQAAVGAAQMERIELFLAARRQLDLAYRAHLDPEQHILQRVEPGAEAVCWLFSLRYRTQEKLASAITRLSDRNIETRPLFRPLHTLVPFRTNGQFPCATMVATSGITLPTFVGLTMEQVDEIASCLL